MCRAHGLDHMLGHRANMAANNRGQAARQPLPPEAHTLRPPDGCDPLAHPDPEGAQSYQHWENLYYIQYWRFPQQVGAAELRVRLVQREPERCEAAPPALLLAEWV
jgi:hypothetical protein